MDKKCKLSFGSSTLLMTNWYAPDNENFYTPNVFPNVYLHYSSVCLASLSLRGYLVETLNMGLPIFKINKMV